MSEWGQSLTLTKNVNKTSPTYYRQIRLIVHIGDIWLHCALKCYTVRTTSASMQLSPNLRLTRRLLFHSCHLRPYLTHFSLRFLNINVNDLSGSHHQATTLHIQTSLPHVVVVTTTVSLQRPRTFSIYGGCGFLPWGFLVTISTVRQPFVAAGARAFLVTISTVRQPFVTAGARAFLRCCKPTGLHKRRHDTLTAFSAKRCNLYSALCQQHLFPSTKCPPFSPRCH